MQGTMPPPTTTEEVPEEVKRIVREAKGRVLTLGEAVNILIHQGHRFEEIRSLSIDYVVAETNNAIARVNAPNS